MNEPSDNSRIGMPPRFAGVLKPLFWFWLAAMVVLTPVGLRLWQLHSIPDIGEPFDVEAYLREIDVPPDDENAAALYRAAENSFVEFHTFGSALGKERYAAFQDSYWQLYENGWQWHLANEDVRDWLERNRQALDLWRKGTERPQLMLTHPADFHPLSMSSLSIGTFGDLVDAAKLESARLTAEGKPSEAWQWQLTIYRCSRHWRMNATAIDFSVGIAFYAFGTDATHVWAAHESVGAAELRQALRDLETLHAQMPAPSMTLKNEYIIAMRTLQTRPYWYEDWYGGSPMAWTAANLTGETEMARRVLKLIYANWLSQIDKPAPHRARKLADDPRLFQVGEEAMDDPNLYPPEDIRRWAERGFQAPELTDYLSRAAFDQGVTREQARQALLVVELALQLYYRENGEFPESLDALAGDILDEIPADPYGRGEPIRYRRDPQSPQRAILWTIGVDRQNQNAEPPVQWGVEGGDHVVEVVGPQTAE